MWSTYFHILAHIYHIFLDGPLGLKSERNDGYRCAWEALAETHHCLSCPTWLPFDRFLLRLQIVC